MSQTSVYGAMVTTVADAARHLDVTAGPDDRDRTTLPPPGLSYERAIEDVDLRGRKALWSADLGQFVVDPEVATLCQAAAAALADAAGIELVDVPFRPQDPLRMWLRSGALDLWDDLEEGHWPDRREDMTPLVRLGLDSTEGFTPWKLVKGARRRLQFEAEVAELFAEVDFLLTPTTAVPAFDAEGPLPTTIAGREVAPGHANPFTMLANLCWNPAVSVPAGVTSDGLPVGFQVVGRRHQDHEVLRAARILEQARPWPRFAPEAG
jgi:aspartyl-tRNA(Asn)/glutamyl-tRNA(Gln) amidotransferase subunit A